MARLTERFSNGQAAVAGCGSNCVHGYKYCDGNKDCPTLNAIFEKLARYEDLEEKGAVRNLEETEKAVQENDFLRKECDSLRNALNMREAQLEIVQLIFGR